MHLWNLRFSHLWSPTFTRGCW